MMKRRNNIRFRNPFYHPLVTELIEDTERYTKVFSQRILVGETLALFQATNTVLLGPQGSGKSMILNLIRYPVLSQWIKVNRNPPSPLEDMGPFLGISINLLRAGFHAFGRRSVSRLRSSGQIDQELDATCAADFLNHFLFREFLKGIEYLISTDGTSLRNWMNVRDMLNLGDIIRKISSWECWFGYYDNCHSLKDLLIKCEQRLNIWRSFLCANIDDIPDDVWQTKSMIGQPQHYMGNLLRDEIKIASKPLTLFVVIDQYEVLRELNPTYGTSLQRLVNTLIKSRDPVVFYKIGARTYDWGAELRISGAESRIEIQRDYIQIDLAHILMRNEDGTGWLFPEFCQDVAYKRLREEGRFIRIAKDYIKKMVGDWKADKEALLYFKDRSRKSIVMKKLSERMKIKIDNTCGFRATPLELRLAGAWALQKKQRGVDESDIISEIKNKPWKKSTWAKERVAVALLQIASISNQKPRYYGWNTILYLSGANITAFLLICSKIWDATAKIGINPIRTFPLRIQDQSEGIYLASDEWLTRGRNEHIGGRQRYEFINRLGPSIHDALVSDFAISNPGHSGLSLKESDFSVSVEAKKTAEFLQNAVSWAILEERPHTSKLREGVTRRKWYLHPLLSPSFGIPYKRVKEPLYTDIKTVYGWIFENVKIKFIPTRRLRKETSSSQRQLSFE